MPQFTPLFIFLDFLGILAILIGISISSLILYIIARQLPRYNPIGNLLLGNTCICTLELCLSNLIIYIYILISDVKSPTPVTTLYDQQNLCPFRSYLLFTGFSLLYTSYCLQAYYRLRQVIYYKTPCNYKGFVYLCVIQWIFSFLLVLPMLLTDAFVYLPTENFCPIPFSKPLSVAYIAVGVYGIFLMVFVTIYLWIYRYATQTTSITIRRRRTIDRQFTMLKRMILPTFSLLFLGIVYLTMFFQAIANQYRTHFLTYRLSYLFIAIGIGLMHIITISLTPPVRKAAVELFSCLQKLISSSRTSSNSTLNNTNISTQPQVTTDEQLELLGFKQIK